MPHPKELKPLRLGYLTRNPVYRGLLEFILLWEIQRCGVELMNTMNLGLKLCHLYNALREEGLLARHWPDLEILIDFQKKNHIFVGERPNDMGAYLSRVKLASGLSLHSTGSQSVFKKSKKDSAA